MDVATGDAVSADPTEGTSPFVEAETTVSAVVEVVAVRSKLGRGTGGGSGLLGKGGGRRGEAVLVATAFDASRGDFCCCSSRRVQIFCTTGGDAAAVVADTVAIFLPLLVGLDMEVAAAAAEDDIDAAAAAFCKLVCGDGGTSCCCNFWTASLSACN
jgi:hypothetical protein